MYESMVFYRSFYEAIKDLPLEAQGRIYSAIFAYGLDGEPPELQGLELSIFTLIKPQIDANNRKRENGKKGASYGQRGGRPKQENGKETAKKRQENGKETPNVNDNVNVNENDNVNGEGEGIAPTLPRTRDPEPQLYGLYHNVRLTDGELQALMDTYPDDYREMIENLSAYMKSKGKYYEDHFATMMRWKRQDGEKAKTAPPPKHGTAEELANFYQMADDWAARKSREGKDE